MKETREITQTKVYILVLNPMTDKAEAARVIAVAFEKEKLIQFYRDETAPEPWQDGRFNKTFKKGSVLEWFNPVPDINSMEPDFFGQGVYEDWLIEEDIDPSIHIIT